VVLASPVVFQLLNATLHSVSLFVALEPANETGAATHSNF
jgi:hypothetical protein